MNRQQRRAQERANAKLKVVSYPSAMQLCVVAALPFLARPPALNSTIRITREAQANASSNAAGPGAGLPEQETKTCTKCKENKPISEYVSKAVKNTTSPYYSNLCKSCITLSRQQELENEAKREIQRQERRRQREQQDEQIKKHIEAIERAKQTRIQNEIAIETKRDLEARLIEIRENPPQEHPRHESGWPVNPFGGTKRTNVTPLPPKVCRPPHTSLFGKGTRKRSTEIEDDYIEDENELKRAIA
ncbi:hypothetical protein [Paraburkholderia sp. C35]|uniref:hypothetical protein n=1 Tax=Paraburkholderia sp. C35 TaxID=2126993 RepID=UPI0013A58BDF|nr:hypothetical protein [Paraburkholderia sp. C35]